MKGPVEFWKKHPDIGSIEVSSLGRVRSVKGHYYKSQHDHGGYLQLQFHMNGKRVNKKVHRLVAQMFIPNPNDLPFVNHKDGDRKNNNASNLEWCTASYNSRYREKIGKALGRPVFAINLSTLKVSRFTSQNEASLTFEINSGNINAVIAGRIKQTGGYWFVNDDNTDVDITKQKLLEIGKTRLTAADTASADFVRQVLAD